MSERTETEIKKMTKEEAYLTGYNDCKSDMLSVIKDIKAEMEEVSPVLIDDALWKYLYKAGWKDVSESPDEPGNDR